MPTIRGTSRFNAPDVSKSTSGAEQPFALTPESTSLVEHGDDNKPHQAQTQNQQPD